MLQLAFQALEKEGADLHWPVTRMLESNRSKNEIAPLPVASHRGCSGSALHLA
jgi:hypothetical protein